MEDAPVEVLLLTPDGRLLVRDSENDAQDEDRVKRHDAWKSRVSGLKPKVEAKPDKFDPFGGGKPGDERPNP